MTAFTVPGEPKGKARPRFDPRRKGARPYTPKATAEYEHKIVSAYRKQCRGEVVAAGVPVTLDISAYFGIPKSAGKVRKERMANGDILPTKRPDVDNIIKCVADALNGVAYHDDAQVAEVTCRKYYSDNPRLEIRLTLLREENNDEQDSEMG